jgi:hypothetical protein
MFIDLNELETQLLQLLEVKAKRIFRICKGQPSYVLSTVALEFPMVDL